MALLDESRWNTQRDLSLIAARSTVTVRTTHTDTHKCVCVCVSRHLAQPFHEQERKVIDSFQRDGDGFHISLSFCVHATACHERWSQAKKLPIKKRLNVWDHEHSVPRIKCGSTQVLFWEPPGFIVPHSLSSSVPAALVSYGWEPPTTVGSAIVA